MGRGQSLGHQRSCGPVWLLSLSSTGPWGSMIHVHTTTLTLPLGLGPMTSLRGWSFQDRIALQVGYTHNCPIIIIMDRSFSMTFHRFRVSKIDFFVKWINILWCYKRFWKLFWTFYSSNIVSWFPQKYWAAQSFSIVIIITKKFIEHQISIVRMIS